MTNVVIGAGSGMGIEVARALAPRGHLIAADRDLEAVEAVAAKLGPDVTPVECDVTDQQQIDALVGRIDTLDAIVLTAGLSGSMANGRRIFEVNLIGTARVLASVEPLLRPGTVGVCFASMSGYRVPDRPELMAILDDPLSPDFFDKFAEIGIDPDAPQLAYPTSKRGVHRLVRRLCPVWGAGRSHPVCLTGNQRHPDEPARRVTSPDHGGHHQGQSARSARPPGGSRERRRVPHLRQGVVHDRERRPGRRGHGRHHSRGLHRRQSAGRVLMAGELAGKVAVVTGGSSGIGLGTAQRFIAEGARVVIADVNRERGEESTKELGANAAFKLTDVSEPDQVAELVRFATERFGGLHVMFNNAGISGVRHPTLLEDDLSDFHTVMGVNLLGTMAGTREAARHMSENGGGSIINISSIGGIQPAAGLWSYHTSKASVIMFTKCAAIDLGRFGIRVNCIAPGNIETPILEQTVAGNLPPEERAELMAKVRAFIIAQAANPAPREHGRHRRSRGLLRERPLVVRDGHTAARRRRTDRGKPADVRWSRRPSPPRERRLTARLYLRPIRHRGVVHLARVFGERQTAQVVAKYLHADHSVPAS